MRRYLGVFVVLGLVLVAGLARVDSVRVSELGSCPVVSISDSVLGFQDSICHLHHSYGVAVIEGDESSLQKALHLVHSRSQEYVAVLFYASWCPFSRNFRPSFSILSTLYPSIPHFAIAESAVKPSILSKYGVHGFPALFLLNSTMRVRYRGSRSLSSLVSFYSEVTGIEGDPRDQLPFDKIESVSNQERSYNEVALLPFDKIESVSNQERSYNEDPEDCPFSWARSPENLLREETYLALATIFVLLRLMYLWFPYLLEFARITWRKYMQHVRVTALWELPLRCLNKTKQFLSSFRDAWKGRNFQEGAAQSWASKSLASAVSIGNASASRIATVSGSQ